MARRAANPSSASTNKCVVCDRTFARLEHLKRHIRSHTRDKPFKCLTCGKNFSRLDVLNRHHSSHQQAVVENTAGASDRACRECAATRVRCSRGDPCRRCEERDLDCTYPAAKKRRATSSRQVGVVTPPLEDLNMPSGLLQIPSPSATASNEDTRQPIIAPAVADEIVSTRNPINGRPGTNSVWLDNAATNPSLAGVLSDAPWVRRVDPLDGNTLQNDQGAFQYNSLYGLDSGNCYMEQAMGVLSTNWMSPPQQNLLDWGSQLAVDPSGNVDSGVFDLPLLFNTVEPTREPMTEQPPDSSSSAPPLELTHSDELHTSRRNHPQLNSIIPSEAGSMSSVPAAGEYYVDGSGARAPFQGQPIQKRTVISVEVTSDAVTEGPASISPSVDEILSGEAYYNMVQGIQAELQVQSLEVDMSSFPSQEHIRAFIVLYFERFHPIYPFLRKSAFISDSLEHWILLLAVATVGARYTRNPQGSQPREMLLSLLQKFMNRRISGPLLADEGIPWSPSCTEDRRSPIDLPVLQADVLNVVCMLYSGRRDLMRRAFVERYYLVNACNALDLLASTEIVANSASGNESQIRTWLERQSRIRTGMMIWALDCILVYEFDCKPLMRLTDAIAPLPCLERLWENPSVDAITAESSGSATLLEALEVLYMEKRLPSNLSQFGTNLLIYGIYRKTKEVICDHRTQLSSWTPSARIQSRTKSHAMGETWPPSTLLLSNWRNSASDCLDILHWCANGTAARAAGWESPTILHLHLARLILLTPTKHLQVLATTLSSSSTIKRLDNTKYVNAHKHVLRWALRDQFKARLSVVHAGALFWHVRRFSSNSFVEPFAIYIATLVVWAYSIMSNHFARPEDGSQVPQALDAATSSTCNSTPPGHLEDPGVVGTPTAETEPYPEPSFVHLDRPCDDEMVQTYVRFGHRMTGYMLRVGNICDRSAPRKILEEGIRLLIEEQEQILDAGILGRERENTRADQEEFAPDSWGIERSYAKVLRCLIQGTMEQRS